MKRFHGRLHDDPPIKQIVITTPEEELLPRGALVSIVSRQPHLTVDGLPINPDLLLIKRKVGVGTGVWLGDERQYDCLVSQDGISVVRIGPRTEEQEIIYAMLEAEKTFYEEGWGACR